jgi:hypothetical protein
MHSGHRVTTSQTARTRKTNNDERCEVVPNDRIMNGGVPGDDIVNSGTLKVTSS